MRHLWEDWSWDETVFEGTASYYRQGRNPYAPGILEALADALGLDGQGRLLDVGCGPGTLTLLFAHLFEEVVGLDSDPGMIAEVRSAAEEADIDNATCVCMRAEELPGELGLFRVVTFGQSFHWMDRPKVASIVHDMLQPGGEVVQVDLWHDPLLSCTERVPTRRCPDRPSTSCASGGSGLIGGQARVFATRRQPARTRSFKWRVSHRSAS